MPADRSALQRIDPRTRPVIKRLAGPRVTLRPLAEADLPTIAAALSKPGAAEWWPITSEAGLREDVLSDESTSLAIEFESHVIGIVMYEEVLWRDYFSAGIDIAIDPGLRGRGLGPETLSVLIGWLVDVGGHHRISIDPAAANASAIRAYEKVGFRPVGIMRCYERGPDGHWRDSLLMDLLAHELRRLEPPAG